MNIECWIITLNPEKPDVLALRAQFEAFGITPRMFQAVDGRAAMPALQPGEVLDQKGAISFRCAPLGTAEVGCYLSHYRLIGQLYNSGAQAACIFEDDVVLEDNFREALDAVSTLDDSYELVRLMGLRLHPRKVCKPLGTSFQLVRPTKGSLGTQGYRISRSGMRKILQHGRVINKPIDHVFDTFWEIGLRQFVVEPHALYERGTSSDISRPKGREDDPISLLRWKVYKFIHKTWYKIYLLLHYRDFFPASNPPPHVGKSPRLR